MVKKEQDQNSLFNYEENEILVKTEVYKDGKNRNTTQK